jgi:multicomponent Na+:H+ antiporter subunit E
VRTLIAIGFSYMLWLLLTWTVNGQHLLAGAVAAVLTGLIFGRAFVRDTARLLQPKRWFWAFVYGWVFLWEMIKANLDVAYRVIHPGLPIRPGIVKVRTKIRSEMGRVFLANSITLTPGTFTVDIKEDVLYIHWIYVRQTDIEKASEIIVGPFESFLIKIFD